MLRVFLAAPHTSGRALADSFHLVAGFDSTTVSRPTIGSIKAAWADMYIRMVKRMVRDFVEGHLRYCERARRPFVSVTFEHVQDEADIRLRSGDARDGPKLPKRGRASKVQMHVVRIAVGHHRQEIPTELEALGDKGTGTLATSLEGTLREILQDVLPASDSGPEIWVIHLLIGDAVPTNDAAARVIWASVKERPLGQRVRYFEMVVKCMVHQSGLSAKCGVIGSAASTAGDCHDVTGVAVRLFKYLLNDYYEEFCANTYNWVFKSLSVVDRSAAERTLLGRGQSVHKLRELYTEHVVPDKMVTFWHMVAVGADPVASRSELEKELTAFIVKFLLTPDEHPTLSRFFTFRKVIDAMLCMDLIGLPLEVFKLDKIKPQEENQKRLKKVAQFFSNPAARQSLRRASLVLQLTGGLEALTAAEAKEGKPPQVVTFVNGYAHDLVEKRLRRLFGAMSNASDPVLEIGPAVSNLLGTAADLVLRFNKLLGYPFILCRCCKKWFPTTYLNEIMQFLNAESEILDVGVSMQLRDIAVDQRNEAQALAWMSSGPVQDFLEQIANDILSHSLDAERRAAQVKRWESTKVTHIATASLNNICARFAKEREKKSLAIDAALKRLRRARKTRVSSILGRTQTCGQMGSLLRRRTRRMPKHILLDRGARRMPKRILLQRSAVLTN